MTTFPLVTHSRAEDVFAYSLGQPITVAHFLADVRHLAAALPAGRHVLNACGDRYRFAVGMAAALLADKISLLPPTLTPEMVRQIKRFAPDVFCLTDQPQSIDLPLFAWTDAATSRSLAGAPIALHDIPQIPAARTAAIVFTSGSTGTPVAHYKSWGGLVQSVRAEAARLGLLDGRRHTIVATVPPQHMYGFESTVLIVMQSGNALVADEEIARRRRDPRRDHDPGAGSRGSEIGNASFSGRWYISVGSLPVKLTIGRASWRERV